MIKLYINGKFDSVHNPNEPAKNNDYVCIYHLRHSIVALLPGSILTIIQPVRFGRASRGGSSWRPHHAATIFDGSIDEISMWSMYWFTTPTAAAVPIQSNTFFSGRVFDEHEIYKYMFERPIGKEPELVGWWNFNEGSGTIVASSYRA